MGSLSKMIKKTKIYMKGKYNKKVASTVFEGKDKGYYAWIKRGGIQIEVISQTKENIMEIQDYLDFLFRQKYIGISFEDNENMDINFCPICGRKLDNEQMETIQS